MTIKTTKTGEQQLSGNNFDGRRRKAATTPLTEKAPSKTVCNMMSTKTTTRPIEVATSATETATSSRSSSSRVFCETCGNNSRLKHDERKLEHANGRNNNKVATNKISSSETGGVDGREEKEKPTMMSMSMNMKIPQFTNTKYQMNLQVEREAFRNHLLLVFIVTSLMVLLFTSKPISGRQLIDSSVPNERLQFQQQQQQWELTPAQQQQLAGARYRQLHEHQQRYLNQQQQQQGHFRTQNSQDPQEAMMKQTEVEHNFNKNLAQLLQPSTNLNQHHVDLQHQASQQSPTYWTSDLWPSASNQEQQVAEQAGNSELIGQQSKFTPNVQQQQQVASGSTTPTISRQLVAPPSFYEIGLAPTNAIQIELADEQQQQQQKDSANRNRFEQAQRNLMAEQQVADHSSGNKPSRVTQHNGTARSNEHFSNSNPSTNEQQTNNEQTESNSNNNVNKNHDQNINGDADKASSSTGAGGGGHDVTVEQNQMVDKSIEPRQRRRIFNRILKKAEWNHLFVELSKVFLRYFLDLALKDIIGKQSGAETTTSRKKLDAQSELTDLLKDFVKTAISNI